MIFCTPFNSNSPFDYNDYAALLEKRGPNTNHHHLIVSTKADEDKAFKFGTKLTELFGRSFFKTISEGQRGHIQTANDLLWEATTFTAAYQIQKGEVPDPPLLYMDPSYRPMKPKWLDTLQAEYYVTQAKRVMGSGKKAEDGSVIFTGPVILSKEFITKSSLLRYLQPRTHWREALKWEMNADFHLTKSIGATSSPDHLLQPRGPRKEKPV